MRTKFLGGIFLFCFFSLTVGLFYTQIVKHGFYRKLSENNRIRVLTVEFDDKTTEDLVLSNVGGNSKEAQQWKWQYKKTPCK